MISRYVCFDYDIPTGQAVSMIFFGIVYLEIWGDQM